MFQRLSVNPPSKGNKVRELFFKRIHCIVITKKCKIHSFYDCQTAVTFFEKELSNFNSEKITSLQPNTQELLFRMTSNNYRNPTGLNFFLPFVGFTLPKNVF